MSLSDRTGQVDIETGMSFTSDGTLKEHLFPRLARCNEQVGAYAIAGAQEVLSRLALLQSGVPLYEPGEAPLPAPHVRRLVGGFINASMTPFAVIYGSEAVIMTIRTLREFHQAVFPQ